MQLVGNKIERCGWVPHIPDQRDRLYATAVVNLKKRPATVDLRPQSEMMRGRLLRGLTDPNPADDLCTIRLVTHKHENYHTNKYRVGT